MTQPTTPLPINLVGNRRVWKHLADELGGDRILFVDRLVASEDEGVGDNDQEAANQYRFRPPASRAAVGSQELWRRSGGALGRLRRLRAHRRGVVAIHAGRHREDREGQLHSCLCCQAPGRRVRGRCREPARPIRAESNICSPSARGMLISSDENEALPSPASEHIGTYDHSRNLHAVSG